MPLFSDALAFNAHRSLPAYIFRYVRALCTQYEHGPRTANSQQDISVRSCRFSVRLSPVLDGRCIKMSRLIHITLQITLIAAISLTIAHGYRLNSKLIDTPPFSAADASLADQQRLVRVDTAPLGIGYVKASIPMRVFSCMQQASILRCLKLFLLKRMERTDVYANSGNVTADFLDQMLRDDGGDHSEVPLLYEFELVSDVQLDERLLVCLRRFFRDRQIKLYFLPGLVVKVVPSAKNFLHFTVRKGEVIQTVKA